jgi:ACT domain-containing protein
MSNMGDMTPEEKRELYARLDELKPLPGQVDTIIRTLSKMELSLLSIYGNPEAIGSRGMIHELQTDVRQLKVTELARLSKKLDDQDVKIKSFEELRDSARGYMIGIGVGSGMTGGGIGIVLTKILGG